MSGRSEHARHDADVGFFFCALVFSSALAWENGAEAGVGDRVGMLSCGCMPRRKGWLLHEAPIGPVSYCLLHVVHAVCQLLTENSKDRCLRARKIVVCTYEVSHRHSLFGMIPVQSQY